MSKKDIEFYKEEIKRKEKEIEELKKQNELLLKAALKSSHKLEELREKLEKYTQK
jgi:hypothetical protein